MAVKTDDLQAVAYPKMLYANYFSLENYQTTKFYSSKLLGYTVIQFMLWMWGSYIHNVWYESVCDTHHYIVVY